MRRRRWLICISWLVACGLHAADDVDFHATAWTQIEDGVAFEYIVLKKGNSRILIPKLSGYSLDSSSDKLAIYKPGVEITLRMCDKSGEVAVRQGDVNALRELSRPPNDENNQARLVRESSTGFAARNWRSYVFEYSQTSFGRTSDLWIGYIAAFDRTFLVRINAAPDAFPTVSEGVVKALIRSREIDAETFERQATRN